MTLAHTLLNAGGDALEALDLARKAETIVTPHAEGDIMVVYDSTMQAVVKARLRLGDKPGAILSLEDYRALLDGRAVPADSRWRKSIERMQGWIRG